MKPLSAGPCRLLAGIVLLWALVLPGRLSADMRMFTLLELAETSEVVLTGKVTLVGPDTASLEVTAVLAGKWEPQTAIVSPIDLQHCTHKEVNFRAGETVLIFGNAAGDQRVTIQGAGNGKLNIDASEGGQTVAAAKRVLTLVPLSEHEKNLAMLAEVRSPNARLRFEARNHVVGRLAGSEERQRYSGALATLLQDEDPALQEVGLNSIRFVKAPEAIERIAALSRSSEWRVVSAASMALAQYDTATSVAALVALTRHSSPDIRSRACLDLGNGMTKRPEAKAALVALLDDKNPAVRATAPIGLVSWLRYERADDVLPKLIHMMNDDDRGVRISAADKLGERQLPDVVPPLLAALKAAPPDREWKRALVGSLYCQYSKGGAQGKALIDEEIELVIEALKTGAAQDDFGPSFQAVGILGLSPRKEADAALRWASTSHPNAEIRGYAQRSLAQ